MSNKFRVWCNDKNEWEKDYCVLNQDGILLHQMKNGYFVALKKESHIVEFSTGSTYENGKEMYAGDRAEIRYNNGTESVEIEIKWSEYGAGFSGYSKAEHFNCYSLNYGGSIVEGIYFIGTIHDK